MTTDDLADIIKNRRVALGYSQDLVAEFCDIDRTTLGRIENHYRTMTVEQADKLIRALGLGELGIIPAAADGSEVPFTIASAMAEMTGNKETPEPMFSTPKEYSSCAFVTNSKTNGFIYGQMDDSGEKLIVRNDGPDNRFNKNVFVVGESSSGKTQFCANNIIQAGKRKESVIVTDPHGELYDITHEDLEKAGYKVKRICFDEKHPDIFNTINLIPVFSDEERKTQMEHIQSYAERLAEAIIHGSLLASGVPFYEEGREPDFISHLQILLLSSVIEYVIANGKEKNLITVTNLIESGLEYLRHDVFSDDNVPGIINFRFFEQASSNNSAGNAISSLANILCNLPNQFMFPFPDLRDVFLHPTSLFIVWDGEKGKEQTALAWTLLTYLMRVASLVADGCEGYKLPHNTMFVLDEFPYIPHLEMFDRTLATCRRRGFSFLITAMNTDILEATYPKDWVSILSNCPTLISLGTQDMFTVDMMNKRIGDTAVVVAESCGKKKRLLDRLMEGIGTDIPKSSLNEEKLPSLKRDEEYILFSAHRPIKAKKFFLK